jgi:hypothetical protein
MKQWVDTNNTTFRTNDKHLCEKRFKETAEGKWISVCEHLEKVEKQYRE